MGGPFGDPLCYCLPTGWSCNCVNPGCLFYWVFGGTCEGDSYLDICCPGGPYHGDMGIALTDLSEPADLVSSRDGED